MWPERYQAWNNIFYALQVNFIPFCSIWAMPVRGTEGLYLSEQRGHSLWSSISSTVTAELFPHRECHNYLGLVRGCRLWYLIAQIYLFRVGGWNLISGEKSQTWSMFLFGGFSHSSRQVLAYGSPSGSLLPPPLVHRELRAVFTAPDFRCLIFRCVEEECGHAKLLLQIQPLALAWI